MLVIYYDKPVNLISYVIFKEDDLLATSATNLMSKRRKYITHFNWSLLTGAFQSEVKLVLCIINYTYRRLDPFNLQMANKLSKSSQLKVKLTQDVIFFYNSDKNTLYTQTLTK